ncbi:hypothetical protein [Ruegeria atlantica]|uniref:Uncharacterized protein n=1 Tax=Ruegeria atlantica TaxID=81569 RepID=A0A0P1E6D9_9RHOB|nr:hypothetical protein [Ruegeria atlantica]CUH43225.1 hypothetical protein RUM4293_02118 [Ruegeria atlantica]
MPLQNVFFPEYPSRASLLFLPHGVRVLAAWLLGWRAIFALLPGVFAVFAFLGGADVFLPSRLLAIVIAVTTVPTVFYLLKWAGWDLFPSPDRKPCWLCVMGVGVITSFLASAMTNMSFGSAGVEYIAFLIGDFSGLFFLMLGLYFAFRFMDRRT